MIIRPERQEDARSISQVTTAAFENAPHSGGNEARIIDTLRRTGALTVSLVAIDDHLQIIGHIAFSSVQIDERPGRWYGLGPVSVVPELQRKGIGRALVTDGLGRLRQMEADGCVVMGDPGYYGGFGFASDPRLTYLRYPNPYFQRLVLGGHPPCGDVTYHPAFGAE